MANSKRSKQPAKRKPAAPSKPRSKLKPKPKSKPKPKPKAKPNSSKPSKPRRRLARPALSVSPTGAVMHLIEAERPVDALRAFLDGIDGALSVQQGQIALGAAQLMLLSFVHDESDDGPARADPEVKELLDLVLARWRAFPDPAGFHAQELLRNAFAAIGDDPERLVRLAALVPDDANSELRFQLARAMAIAGERSAMLRAVATALAAGADAAEFANDPAFAEFGDDDELRALLQHPPRPPDPIDLGFHIATVRIAIDALAKTLRHYGEPVTVAPGASLDTILAAERARGIELPNDYRALLTICDGMTMWDHQFFATEDYRTDSKLAKRARRFLEHRWSDCVPLANWGRPDRWLVCRNGEPGVVLVVETEEHAFDDVVAVLEYFEAFARDTLGTN